MLNPRNKIEVNFSKLNLYGEGGFFKPHVDTLIDSKRMIGTLIVWSKALIFLTDSINSLPMKHTGGQLVVTHGDLVEEYDFSSDTKLKDIQWVALYSDCKHEVKPVTRFELAKIKCFS